MRTDSGLPIAATCAGNDIPFLGSRDVLAHDIAYIYAKIAGIGLSPAIRVDLGGYFSYFVQ
jgi:hypothetical protein